MPLIDRADSVLVVVDAQPGFSGAAEDAADAARSRAVAGWLVGVAAAFNVPILVTEEDPDANGRTDPAISDRLPPGTPVLAKAVFGLAGVPEILAAVEATGRRTAVLVGAETDVCVAQSAMGLLDVGLRVVVVSDATFSPGAMQDLGLRRIGDARGELAHAKAVYYEWARTLETARAFQADHPDLATPPGFRL
jgi:nicotinamidase-related amidase